MTIELKRLTPFKLVLDLVVSHMVVVAKVTNSSIQLEIDVGEHNKETVKRPEDEGDLPKASASPLRHQRRSADHSPLHPLYQAKLGEKGNGVSSPSWERKSSSEGTHGLAPLTPVRSRMKSSPRGNETASGQLSRVQQLLTESVSEHVIILGRMVSGDNVMPASEFICLQVKNDSNSSGLHGTTQVLDRLTHN